MKILVILAHPGHKSFNSAIAGTVVSTLRSLGIEVIFHDLYRENFDPILKADEITEKEITDKTIAQHCGELTCADGIIIVHPNWWGQPPAILKGWVDRVIRPGVAYQFSGDDSGEGVPEGLLKGKTALVFNTSDTPDDRERQIFGDPLENTWTKCIFKFCGISRYKRKVFNIIVTSTEEERKNWLKEAETIVKKYFT